MNPLDKSATQSPTQYPHPLFIFVFESQTNGGNGKKTDGGGGSVCSSHPVCSSKHEPVFTMSVESKCCVCFYKASSKQDDVCAMSVESKCCVCFFFKPRASKMTSVSCRLRQSVVSFFFNPWASRIASVSCRLLPSCLLYASHRNNVDPSRKHEPVFIISVESKWCVCFFLSLEQARSRLCHVGLVKMLCLFFF